MPKKGSGKVKADKPKGKWGHLVGVLPRITTEEPDKLDKIDLVKQQIIEDYATEQTAARLVKSGIFQTTEEATEAITAGDVPRDNVSPPTAMIVDQYLALKDAKTVAQAKLNDIELELDALKKMMDEHYDAENLSGLRTSTGEGVFRHFEPYPVVTDPEAVRKWAVKNGLENKLALNWNTLKAELSAMLESGKAVYDGEKLVGGPDGVDAFLVAKFTKRGGK